MKYANYLIFRLFVSLFSITPFWLFYMISDFVAFLLQKVVRYRVNIVQENLSLVYPNFDKKKRNILIKNIYKNLSDIMLESLKGFSLTETQLKARHKLMQPEPLDTAFKMNKSVMLVTGHYGNWEWGAFSPNYFINQTVIGFYKPLTNKYINKYALKRRAKSGTVLADINETAKYYEEYYDKNCLFLMAADQSPTKPKYAIWTDFLGIKTPCIHGIEKYVFQYDLAVLNCNIVRVKRGFYELHVEWITSPTDEPKEYGENTKIFMKKLEDAINKTPENWLWSHNRWKHKDYQNPANINS